MSYQNKFILIFFNLILATAACLPDYLFDHGLIGGGMTSGQKQKWVFIIAIAILFFSSWLIQHRIIRLKNFQGKFWKSILLHGLLTSIVPVLYEMANRPDDLSLPITGYFIMLLFVLIFMLVLHWITWFLLTRNEIRKLNESETLD